MPDNTKPTPPQDQALPTTRAEKFVRIYSNAANMEVTPWDFKIVFGELKRTDGKPVIEQSVEITMSPQHAKALAGMLSTNVREYETQIGEIKLPPTPEPTSNQQSPMPVHSVAKA
jgi:hypothetical protein